MSRKRQPAPQGRRRLDDGAHRRMNRRADNSVRNKRRILGTLFTLAIVAAVASLALSLVPLFPELSFPGVELLR